MRSSVQLAAILAFSALLQWLIIARATNAMVFNGAPDDDALLLPQPNAGATEETCFPGRRGAGRQSAANATIIIYLETAYVNLHYETYYSFIHEICACGKDKDPLWTIDADATPHFYVGPAAWLTRSFEEVLAEFNTTTCGPIYFGTPASPQRTIVTTSYPDDFHPGHKRQYHELIDDERYIFICHEDAPSLENATNVFFLSPLHNRYVVPSHFPPSIVKRHSKSLRQQRPDRPPIFLVLGSFNKQYRRNVGSLSYPLRKYRDVNFTVRFLGGASHAASNEALEWTLRKQFPDDYHKIEFLPRTDTYEFMRRVAESDVVLPLVEAGPFYHKKGYQGGKKLTSSVMWGLGFAKRMLLYRPLAEVFGIEEDNATYFLHGNTTASLPAFYEGFGRCLRHVLANP